MSNRDNLNEDNFHPDDWAAMDNTEAFFNPRTGGVTILKDNIVSRLGEPPSAPRCISALATLAWQRLVDEL